MVEQRCGRYLWCRAGKPVPVVAADVLRDKVRGLCPLPVTGLGLRAAAPADAERALVCAVDMPCSVR